MDVGSMIVTLIGDWTAGRDCIDSTSGRAMGGVSLLLAMI